MTQLHSDAHNLPDPPDTPITKHARGAEGKGNPVRLAILAAVIALVGLWGGWSLAIVILGVVVMIFLHELGHYLAAKWSDMKVTEFFIGFGPKIWSFRRGETEYGLKVIPAGAYVKIIGMSTLEEVDASEEHRTYRVKSYPRRLLVAIAGSAMHFAQALVLLFIVYAFVGMPGGSMVSERAWEVGEVIEGSAAEDAGLLPGDRVTAIDGRSVAGFHGMASEVVQRPGEDVLLTVSRDGLRLDIPVTIGVRDGSSEVGFLGVSHEQVTVRTGPVSAVGESFREFGAQSSATVGYLASFFTPSGLSSFASNVTNGNDSSGSVVEAPPAPSSVSPDDQDSRSAPADDARLVSIIGAVHIGSTLTESGIQGFLLFFVLINIAIGVINLLPVLPLDGGHVVVATYERIREFFTPKGERYYVDMVRLMPFIYVVVIGFVLIAFTAMYLDIVDPIL